MDINKVREGVKELFSEGYGLGGVWGYLNDLARSKDISREEVKIILKEIADGMYK